MADGPLRDVRILDMTHVWAGPLATRVLADLGANVVKVERPNGRGPRVVKDTPISGWIGGEAGDDPWNNSSATVKLGRNRKSLCIDLKSERGREIFLELVKRADVVIENFSARAMPSLRLGYEVLRELNPRLIYVTMPGYGSHGPYSNWVAFGTTVEPMSGLTSVMGYSKSEPRNTAMAIPDPMSGVSAVAAVLTALRHRQRTGEGARVEMSLHESGVSFSGPWLIEHQLGGSVEPMGNRHPAMVPHGIYRCSGEDDWVAIGCVDDPMWKRLCSVVPGLDAELDPAQRRAQHDVIDQSIEAWTSGHDQATAAEQLQQAGVAAGSVNNTPEMAADPQVQSRQVFVPYERYSVPIPGNPIRMDGLSTDDWTPCPKLGEHNEVVLKEWLGFSDQEVADCVQNEIVKTRPDE